ncbi:MAG: hypothetical protein H7647_05040 [Candidatus Heimdallarchaeota archaeon]|nr:hypothetical protein [Candidatus Heimdallarchaeota archaeon]MCK4253789.1 hypothetical protein [Candidatus Heimdallarchaeota archaeon]
MKRLSKETYKILKPVAVVLTILVVVLMVWYILATLGDQQNVLIFTIFILVTSTLSSLSWFILILEYFESPYSGSKSISSSIFILFGIIFFFLGVTVIVLDIMAMITML